MTITQKIVTGIIVLALILGGVYYLSGPKLAKNYFNESVKDYLDANKTNNTAEYQTALRLADWSFKLQAPTTTQNLYYAQLLAALNRKSDAIALLNRIKATDKSAGAAADALIKELSK